MEVTKEQMATLIARGKQIGQLVEQVRILQYITEELEAGRTLTVNNVVEFINKGDTNG
jgi:hypothetical protein